MTIGKIFFSSWGYEQTNIDFYKVIEVSKSGKTFTLQKIGSQVISNVGYCSDMVIPNEDKIMDEPLYNRRVLDTGYNKPVVNVSKRKDYRLYAYEWDGQPLLMTSYY